MNKSFSVRLIDNGYLISTTAYSSNEANDLFPYDGGEGKEIFVATKAEVSEQAAIFFAE